MIHTDRLILRPLTSGDIDSFVALHTDPKVSRFLDSYPRERAIQRLADVERQWEQRGYGLFAILLKDTGEFVGRCGLNYWEQFEEVEAAWVLVPAVWGRGYATEAAQACLTWGFGTLDVDYITAMIRTGNDQSVRVAERLGFTPRRQEIFADHPVTVYAIDRPDRPSS
ncbi:GNAT family N-acetyltransferase [Nocardia terpenica]|uniref:GNAT family N-acetyltransferase n=1 Tax=Nocardia terpenica TaxID=455432 RepID=A0A291REN3_9NOCA|nr:GNAT family N-acetyltransferase [Nocardia terpenica]ATL65594.1 GNAT family N-acetyltransferase [Nocardia terpenica]